MKHAEPQVTLNGVPGSPYTRKMLSLMRYRRIPYKLILASHVTSKDRVDLPKAKVSLLPTYYFPNEHGVVEAVTDSTPILRRLESDFPDRKARPNDPALAFIDALLEDYGDEWLTKAMFHYRWAYADDIKKASTILPAWTQGRNDNAGLAAFSKQIADRQIPRLRYVGSNETTGPIIEASYIRFLDIMEAHLQQHAFMLGERPGAGDFAAFGQLTQLAQFDPTSMTLTAARAPRVYAWVSAMEDLCGLEPKEEDWVDVAKLPATTKALLSEVGRVYAPLLLANAKALQEGQQQVETQIDGKPWVMQPFTYQGKCLTWLREEYAGLDAKARARVDAALKGTGCEAILA